VIWKPYAQPRRDEKRQDGQGTSNCFEQRNREIEQAGAGIERLICCQ
jgi:hypothetical protein